MNSKQLKCAVVLAETRNFSQAAKKLEISQPAFSKQIINLESELGIKLFERTTIPLSLTAAGEFLVKKARKVLNEEEVLLKVMEQYRCGGCGKLTIGISHVRSLCVTPSLVMKIKEKFPKIDIVIKEHSLVQLRNGILNGDYDFAVLNLPVDERELEVIPLEPDSFVLAVPNHLLGLIARSDLDETKTFLDLARCQNVPFVVVGKSQEMRKIFDRLCSEANIEPNIFVEVTGVTTTREMVEKGAAATIIPKQYMRDASEYTDITLFDIKCERYSLQPAIVMKRGQYVSEYAKYAIEILKNE